MNGQASPRLVAQEIVADEPWPGRYQPLGTCRQTHPSVTKEVLCLACQQRGGYNRQLVDEAVKLADGQWVPTHTGESYYIYQTSPSKVISEFRNPLISVSIWEARATLIS